MQLITLEIKIKSIMLPMKIFITRFYNCFDLFILRFDKILTKDTKIDVSKVPIYDIHYRIGQSTAHVPMSLH